MFEWLWLIPALPLIGFLVVAAVGARLPRAAIGAVGTGSVGLAAVLALAIAAEFVAAPPPGHAFTQKLWRWFQVGGFSPEVALYLDPLAVIMMVVVTLVGFLIHLYSIGFMRAEKGGRRFFAYMNLFVGAMLILVLADNLLLLYLGWEGVGLCSYLLIGFWYTDPANGYAARKAFVVTRVGDTAMAIGLFLLFSRLGTLNIQELLVKAGQTWQVGAVIPTAVALLLLGGAVGKSAQLPLQTWLPDAMAGPTPVSALIHAATMVTAGVYLIARNHALFTLAPFVMTLTAVVGAVTLLMAGFSALVQRDIKRVLAYSTVSQVGYMFLALGLGSWTAAVFHFMMHAFFKALLFLCAGVIIQALGEEHDIHNMGGLRKTLPLTFWAFLIGSGALAAVPLVTAGFYSKDLIIWQAYASVRGGIPFWAAALAGAFLTSLYTFRLVIKVFFGPPRHEVRFRPGRCMTLPLIVLAFLSLSAGFIEIPQSLGGVSLLTEFLRAALPQTFLEGSRQGREGLLQVLSGAVSLGGIALIVLLVRRTPEALRAASESAAGTALRRLWSAGWGFDRLYDHAFVLPLQWLARRGRGDIVDLFYRWIAWAGASAHRTLRLTQTGRTRSYAAGIVLGAVVIIGLAVFL
jgi:NADH-quinone oxidoreductase subunit L